MHVISRSYENMSKLSSMFIIADGLKWSISLTFVYGFDLKNFQYSVSLSEKSMNACFFCFILSLCQFIQKVLYLGFFEERTPIIFISFEFFSIACIRVDMPLIPFNSETDSSSSSVSFKDFSSGIIFFN